MSKHIQAKTSGATGDESELDGHFPLFAFALRDFSLQLEIDERKVTANEYMENGLTLRDDSRSKEYNESRMCIRKYFKNRHCFTFDRPASRKKLVNLECLSDSELSEEFVEDTENFLTFMFQNAPAKKLENGRPINGRSK